MATNDNIVYEPDESPPLIVTFIAGFQGAVVMLTICAVVVSVTLGGAGLSEEYLTWAIFSAFIVNGAATAISFWPPGCRCCAALLLPSCPGRS